VSSLPNLTNCGLSGLNAIPFGLHMCHFYQGQDDLAAALVPYFAAGLRANERCLWITAEPLDVAGAGQALGKAGLDVQSLTRSGALVIRDHADWFGAVDKSNPEAIVALWLEAERRALADGCTGLRIAGNTAFVTRVEWNGFMQYEGSVNRAFANRRIVTLCSYRLGQCTASDLLDVARSHHCMLDPSERDWQVVTTRDGTLANFVAPAGTFKPSPAQQAQSAD
jgi:two-component system, sensor histidine kinase PdtaS